MMSQNASHRSRTHQIWLPKSPRNNFRPPNATLFFIGIGWIRCWTIKIREIFWCPTSKSERYFWCLISQKLYRKYWSFIKWSVRRGKFLDFVSNSRSIFGQQRWVVKVILKVQFRLISFYKAECLGYVIWAKIFQL